MFTNQRYVTSGVRECIPSFLQNILWYLIETMEIETKDYLQVFELRSCRDDGKVKQHIIHRQEEPVYQKEYSICVNAITGKVYVIDDKTHCTMLLANEY